MSDKPEYLKQLTASHSGTESVVSYRFNVQYNGCYEGWTQCTINERAGELQVSSSWGSWSYLWGHSGIGSQTFKQFIANTSYGYVADKLLGMETSVFDPSASNKSFMDFVLNECLISDIDELNDRLVWLSQLDNSDAYLMQLIEIIDEFDFNIDEPWCFLENKTSNKYFILADCVIPSLQKVLRDEDTPDHK